MKRFRRWPPALLAPALLACAAQRPVVYQGEHPTAADQARIDQDVEHCLAIGEQYRGATGGGDAARGAVVGGAVGGAAGAAGGAVWGNAGRGAAAGAAAGATGGLLGSLFRRRGPDPTYQAAVNRCLQDRGHRVIGWD